jgi:hypothetical protein
MGSLQRIKKEIQALGYDANSFLLERLIESLPKRYQGNFAIYPNTILLLVNHELEEGSSVNFAYTKQEYFKAITEHENFRFQYLPGKKPSKSIQNFNRRFLNRIFDYEHSVKYDKNINKFFAKHTKDMETLIFFITIKYITFNEVGRIKTEQGHRTVLFFNNKTGKGLYVDPESMNTYSESKQDPYFGSYKSALLGRGFYGKYNLSISGLDKIIINKLYTILSKILKRRDFSIEPIEYICPQSITKDKNCVFWSLYLTEMYIKGLIMGRKNFPYLMRNFFETYTTKEELEEVIKEYKTELAYSYKEWKNLKKEESFVVEYI